MVAKRAHRPGLVRAVRAAVAEMPWLGPSDQAVVELALTYARRIDRALALPGGEDATKALYLGPHLLAALRALGGAPLERRELGPAERVGGRLAELRALHGRAG